jgi:putative endonuclease
MNRRQALGQWGEQFAGDYLAARGYTILDRNVRTPYGEIDLVARQGETIVFIEVKTRSSTEFGYPEEAITTKKREHLLRASQAYLQVHAESACDWRIDVIAIQRSKTEKIPELKHFENAIT